MDTSDVFDRVAEIADLVDDPEAAHSAEDRLYADLLGAIATGACAHPDRCARIALASKTLEFPRWCA